MQHFNRSADSHEIRPLTGIRGFAASLVVVYHFYPSWVLLLPGLRLFAPFASRGHLGVDLFFILSGFILSYVYSAGDAKLGISEYRRFLWLRIARVYPNHLATLGFLLLIVLVSKYCGIVLSGDYSFTALPAQLTMTHSWPFLNGGEFSWNYPSWSISAEWFAYLLLFPAMWRLLRLSLLGEVSFFIIGHVVLGLWLLFATTPSKQYGAVVQVSCEFISGALLFGAYRHTGLMTRLCQRYISAVFVGVIGLLFFCPITVRLAPTIAVLFFPALLIGLTRETAFISKVFSTSLALWLGRVSYALYMTHAIAQKVIKILLPTEHYVNSPLIIRLLILSANILLILLFAVALYYAVEVPSRNYLRRITVSKPRRATELAQSNRT
jgi:peptidoglycan/LPS O-acetylase OafA/YrhL